MIDFSSPKWLNELTERYSNHRILTIDECEEIRNLLKKFDVKEPLVSIVIPAWNEEENILKTVISLAKNEFDFPCELFVINNVSTDNTQLVLDKIGVRSFFEHDQGIAPARRRGLVESKGKYQLCCDSDTVYPPSWIRIMTEALQKNEHKGVACVYGSYSFIQDTAKKRFLIAIYETITSIMRAFKTRKSETRQVMGFNFGFIRDIGLEVNGFVMDKPRKFRNTLGSSGYVGNSEDGLMALSIKQAGYSLLYVNNRASRVWTSDRRILIDGGFRRAVRLRLLRTFYRKKFDEIAKPKL